MARTLDLKCKERTGPGARTRCAASASMPSRSSAAPPGIGEPDTGALQAEGFALECTSTAAPRSRRQSEPLRAPPPSDGCPSTCRQSVARVAMMSRDVVKMSPRCRGRVAVCRASVAGGSRRRRSLSRRRRSPSRRVAVSRGVAGCCGVSRAGRRLSRRRRGLSRRRRGRVAARRAAVAVCRAAVTGGSPPVTPPSQ